jgi:aspartyl-tRNA(Asn)/glutamyl-tRNA(Gln) amidotransferase subunit A
VHANLVGIPGLVVPGGFVNGLPVGIQLLGKYFDEATLYRAAYAFEQAHPYWKEEASFRT